MKHDRDTVCGEDLEAARKRGFGEGMGIHPHEKGAVDFFRFPEIADRLADGQDVYLVKAVFQRRPPVARGSEGNPLGGSETSGLLA